MKFPNFIIIGATKCGTTALWYNLDKHPEITMATKTPDTIGMSFWHKKLSPTKDDLNWYKSKFSGEVSGEKTTAYYRSKQAMSNISKNIPDVKLILCIRNPVDCGYSKFQMDKRAARVFGDITFDLFKKKYSQNGKFYKYIKANILPFFPKKNLYICIAEYMKSDITVEMGKVFSFLGVEDLNYEGKIVPSVAKDRTGAAEKRVDIELSRHEQFYRIWSRGDVQIKEKLRHKLLDYYKKSNEDLFDFIGFDIKEWRQ